jgi:diguanylate cyclase (GGDEF)-like protein
MTDGMGVRQHSARRAVWPWVIVPVGAVVAAIAAAGTGVADRSAGWNVAWTAAALSAVAGMLLARRSDPDRRTQWTLWTAASVCWLGGQLAWDVYAVVGSPRSPNLADAGWWGFAVLVSAGLRRPGSHARAVRLVALAEAVPLIVATTALTFAHLWGDASSSALAGWQQAAALAYPGVYVTAAVLTLQALVGGWMRRVPGPGPLLVLGGVVLQAVAFILWSRQLLAGSYVVGATVVDPLWALGMVAIGVGGGLIARRPEGVATPQDGSRWSGVLPAATFLLLIAALLHDQISGAPLPARVTLAVGLLCSGVTLIARGVLLEQRLRVLLAGERSERKALAAREARLARSNERMAEDLRQDALTGLRNRRALAEDLAQLDSLADRESFAIVLCDFDHFKAYNDALGHLAGDEALRDLAATIRAQLRAGDAAYRFGGEEVLLILRDLGTVEALHAAERVLCAVRATATPHPHGVGGVVTVSVGVAAGSGDAATMVARADGALYEAKAAGRDRVVAAGDGAGAPVSVASRPAADDVVLRYVRRLHDVARAAVADGADTVAVLETLAAAIRSELRFQTVAVNVLDGAQQNLHVVAVLGDQEARAALLGTVSAWRDWQDIVDTATDHRRAIWLPAGSHAWNRAIATRSSTAAVAAAPDAWHPDDVLLLPVRDSDGAVLAIISVDQPLGGLRPTDSDLQLLMALADHAGIALELMGRRAVSAYPTDMAA